LRLHSLISSAGDAMSRTGREVAANAALAIYVRGGDGSPRRQGRTYPNHRYAAARGGVMRVGPITSYGNPRPPTSTCDLMLPTFFGRPVWRYAAGLAYAG